MWRYSAILLALALGGSGEAYGRAGTATHPARDERLIGRWDITIRAGEGSWPSWLEVQPSGTNALVGRFVAVVGSARPIASVETDSSGFRFAIPPQWEAGSGDLAVEGRMQDSTHLSGSITFPDGKRYDWTAVRAPTLRRASAPKWGAPIHVFDGKSLAGWRALGPNQWEAANGVLRSPRSGSNLVTERTFGDFKLHVEFRYPKGSNSGIYLRGRHEVQVEDDEGNAPMTDHFGGVYGFIAPTRIVARPLGEWNSYDITLVGRMVTVVANGTTVICNREIPGITGGALDSNEGAPGPLLLQGDHGPVEYRNIVLTPARE